MNKLKTGILIIALLVLAGNIYAQKNCLEGKGPLIDKNLEIKDFDKLILNMKATVIFNQTSDSYIKIDAQRRIHSYISKKILNRRLILKADTAICPSKSITIEIGTEKFNQVKNNSSGTIKSDNTFSQERIKFNLNGSGTIEFRTRAQKITSIVNGSGELNVSGRTDKHVIRTEGSGEINAFYLTADKSKVNAYGSGNCNLYVLDKLEAKINGSSTVNYKGDPEIERVISGSGSVKQAD